MQNMRNTPDFLSHDDVMMWKHFSNYLTIVKKIQSSSVYSPEMGIDTYITQSTR